MLTENASNKCSRLVVTGVLLSYSKA